MQESLQEINQLPQQAKIKGYSDLLKSLFERPREPRTVELVTELVGGVVQDPVGLLVSKTVLTELVGLVESQLGGEHQLDFKRSLIEAILAQPDLCARLVRFEDQVSSLRESLAALLESQEEWTEAARALQGIPLEGTHRTVSGEYKLNTYIRIVRLLLEDDNAVNAESYLNRASLLIPESKDEATIIAFKLSQARILDSKRKFEEASKKYHEISFTANLDEEERESCLSAAVVCAVLAPAGPSRTRILTNLFRDERSVELADYKILSKMVLGQIIKDEEMVEFERRLRPHQLAKLPKMSGLSGQDPEPPASKRRLKHGPENVFDRAVIQHNLLSVSKIYNRISFEGLGNLLGLSSTAIEIMVRTMIQEHRLKATIDQVDQLITFNNLTENADEDDVFVSNVAANAATSTPSDSPNDPLTAPALLLWDHSIKRTLQHVESIYQHIKDSSLQSC